MRYLKLSILLLYLSSCDLTEPSDVPDDQLPGNKKFFPVTSYLKGQIIDLKQAAVTPLMYITRDGKKDSAWLSLEETEKQLQPFLEPTIDSTNLLPLFEETRFLDQTINAFTFSYMPKKKLPDSISLRRWDVYVNPENGKVQRIYMVTEKNKGSTQLTWQSDKRARIVTLEDSSGTSMVKEEKEIIWDF